MAETKQPLTEQVQVKMTERMTRVVDALKEPEQSRSEYIRELIRTTYAERVKYGMPEVK